MRAARIVAGRAAAQIAAAHGDQAGQVEPVVPARDCSEGRRPPRPSASSARCNSSSAIARARRARARRAGSRRRPTSIRSSASRIASMSPGGRASGCERRSRAPLPARASGSCHAPSRAVHAAIASPAIAPNTVELATPLPPRRLAPCTPPVSSPAANRPARAVRAVGRELHPAHHVVRGRHHLDQAAGQVETAIGAALHHALELRGDVGRAQVRHREVHAAIRAWRARRASRRRSRARRCRAWRARARGS